MTPVLLDTHIWYRGRHDPKRLSRPQARVLSRAEGHPAAVCVSAISLWELALLATHGRIDVAGSLETWLDDLASDGSVEVLPVTPRIAAAGAQAEPGLHSDPCDRIIVATARAHGLKLLTADQRIREWGGVNVI